MTPSLWEVIRAKDGVSLEMASAPGPVTGDVHWRVRNDLGEFLVLPDEAAAVAHFAYACRLALVRSRQPLATTSP